ncbi:MAG: carboxypeptidase-like regulatory domain-containing protein [Bacteroidota bacterium]
MARAISLLSILIIILSIHNRTFGGSGGGRSRVAKEELIPAVLTVRGIGTADIEILYRKNHAFLPMVVIFKSLRMRADYSTDGSILSGFAPKPGNSFTLNTVSGVVTTKDTNAVLTGEEYTFSEEEVFLREDVFQAIFKINIKYDPRRLLVTVIPTTDMPVVAAHSRELLRKRYFERSKQITPDYFISRNPSLFEMGKLNWTLSNRSDTRSLPRTNYDFRIGGKILFGDLDFDIRGIVNKRVNQNNLRGLLRYPLGDDNLLRELSFGDQLPAVSSYRNIFGFELTNRPSARRIIFGEQTDDTRLPGSSEIEFYDQGLLTKYIPPASDSLYHVTYPLPYGVTDYEYRIYNTWGELLSNHFRTVIPQNELPENVFQYSLIGGVIRGFDKKYGNAYAAYGMTPVLTFGAGSEFYQQGFAKRVVFPYATGIARLTSSLVADIAVSPLSISHGTIDLQLPDQQRFTLSHYVYYDDPTFNLGGIISSTNLSVNYPFNAGMNAFSIGGYASNSIAMLSHQHSFIADASAHLSNVQLFYSFSYAQSNPGTGDFQTILSQSSVGGSVLAPLGLIFRGDLFYDHLGNQMQSVDVGVTKALRNNLFFQATYNRNFQPSFGFILFELNYNLPFLRLFSSTIRTVHDGEILGTVSTNTARGVLLFSTQTGDLLTNTVQQSNRGALLLRAFVDRNGNNQRDPGEEYIPEAKINASSPHLSSTWYSTPNGQYLTNIEPYQKYIAYIDQRSIFENPQYVSKYNAISIVGEPNILKTVNFPVVIGGNIRGMVSLMVKGNPTPVEGITVSLIPQDTTQHRGYRKVTKTFSTGEFEFLAVPPGSYEIILDRIDLSSIGVWSIIAPRVVTVNYKPEGDQVEGVNFEIQREK